MNEFKPYTKRELARWDAAKGFIDKINAKLDANPELVLFWRDSPLKTRVIVHDYVDLGGGHEDKWLAFKSDDGRCTHGVFSLNEACDTPIRDILKEMRSEFKMYKEVKL